jgi:beta-N-acetylglucosaminidase
MDPADAQRFGSFAAAQAGATNGIFAWLRAQRPGASLLFCPTPYCGRMAARKLGGENYLETAGRELLPEIDICWTGPEIVSPEITVAPIREVAKLLRRKPLLWDNLHANDYDGRRFYVGPYSGRPRELLDEVAGILSNPNCEFPLNFIPIRTFADFLHSESFQPREAYLAALREWLPKFQTVRSPVSFDDLALLCDCFYLPCEDGPEAEKAFASIRQALRSGRPLPHVSALRELCARLAELRDRPLFHALGRRLWELREELDLLEKHIAFRSDPQNANAPFTSDFHLPKTYRGGFVPRLQTLLAQNPDGSFTPAP